MENNLSTKYVLVMEKAGLYWYNESAKKIDIELNDINF